ncbi:biotin-dependent carboxyltransferase family protein [Ekhidna sp.]|uniref:5-oxoprolinase subunit C family protein n=1 Tax=Ekhidna sp. TaxID=2608089 RepID=UPI003298954C
MGQLKVIKSGPLATIQDFGRFGHRRYGIPQSGAMDKEMMKFVNEMVGNPDHFPVVEFALMGLRLEVLESTALAVVGASIKLNGLSIDNRGIIAKQGDVVEISAPEQVYAYVGVAGKIEPQAHFGSVSTYLMAGFGGISGRSLKSGDELVSEGASLTIRDLKNIERKIESPVIIHVIKGPEWDILQDDIQEKSFEVHPSSNRMGIRLKGNKLNSNYREIATSAVIPGTIQLPSDGQPIVLMNDCQTTGGYPRIGKVVDEDLGRLAQVRAGDNIQFKLISN